MSGSRHKKLQGPQRRDLQDLPIDIAYYIQQIQIQTAATIKESEKKLKEKGAVNKYIESFIRNSIKAGQRIGEDCGTPEGRSEFIDIA